MRLRAQERETQAIELRKAGATYGQIGKSLGITVPAALRAVRRALDRLAVASIESATAVRTLELQRLDSMLVGIWDQARHGHLKSVEVALKIMERRARLLGLDAPAQYDCRVEARGPEQMTDEELGAARLRAIAVIEAAVEASGVAGDVLALPPGA